MANLSALFSRFPRGTITGRALGLSIGSVYYVCITELLGPVIFENLSTLKPNFSARVIKLDGNGRVAPSSHQHFSRLPMHSLGISSSRRSGQ